MSLPDPPLPEYPFEWDSEARFAALTAAQEVLMHTSRPTSINAVDDALEAAVKAYNARLTSRSEPR